MIKNLPFQFKDLEIHIQKMLTRLGVIEGRTDSIDQEIVDLQAQITENLEKQNEEKYISCIATQRTTNAGASASIDASDGASSTAGSNNTRQLNHIDITPEGSTYFGNITGFYRVPILKPGKYSIETKITIKRAGLCSAFIEVFHPVGSTRVSSVESVTATGAAAGNTSVFSWDTVINISSSQVPSEIGLYGFITTKTANNCWGNYYVLNGQYVDTCSIKITLIEDL